MQLASKFAEKFSVAMQKRGAQYFRQGRVQIYSGSPARADAVVMGSETYAATLTWTKGALKGLCTCHYFQTVGDYCKHLWATLLAAEEEGYLAEAAAGPGPSSHRRAPVAAVSRWRDQLSRTALEPVADRAEPAPWPRTRELVYLLDAPKSRAAQAVVLALMTRQPDKRGGWKWSARPTVVQRSRIAALPEPVDREIVALLLGGGTYSPWHNGGYDLYDRGAEEYTLPPALARTLLPMALATGRCFLRPEKDATAQTPLRWDDGGAWSPRLAMGGDPVAGWHLTGWFRRGEERMAFDEPAFVVPGGFLVASEHVAPLAGDEGLAWVKMLQQHGRIDVPDREREEFVRHLLSSPHLPAIDLPESLRYDEVSLPLRPCLTIAKAKYEPDRLHARLTFHYGELSVEQKSTLRGVYEAATRRFLVRDRDGEKTAEALLWELQLRPVNAWEQREGVVWGLAASKLPRVARSLAEAGWQVVAEGKVFRQPGRSAVSVVSGVDWFELHGTVEYGETAARLPQLLNALKRGETMVTLDDGSYGLLPEAWLRRFGNVAAMGDAEDDHIRFQPRQAGLLDALLSTQPAVDCDEQFRQVRRQLERFESVAAAEQPAGFQGQLREYQREGLGWMHFLRQFSFGGCLADDMGVGKTAQVLALLETRRELRAKGEIDAPSLAVVPKSLIFNWKQEIERFTPQVRVLDYTGIARAGEFSDCDLVLTTYGTLRRDAVRFSGQTFDYIILDEAQAIKNAKTESAKAVRLLRGNHRLALSGTPVENHLGELWSLFEFLNPGMLGASNAFQIAAKELRDPDDATRRVLARTLRPFLLRRTKEQVAKELPAKVEQTIFCELEPKQRALYDELRQHYRDSLLNRIDTSGVAKSKLMVLEALLRLRQAACHPGLIDKTRANEPSAKLDVLLDQLRDIVEEGHKALVFSQFTSLLKLVGKQLAAGGMAYEYLDGKTKDRQAPVDRFQTDPDCRLFLISLKAGGVGLNLTAADYVFILDPWWNPAAEAQAVDRAHRIGQTRQVFAYRLIARGTVEEKILELQRTKRGIADAILGGDNSLIKDLGREDIELLLS